jgi:hypothetical protein
MGERLWFPLCAALLSFSVRCGRGHFVTENFVLWMEKVCVAKKQVVFAPEPIHPANQLLKVTNCAWTQSVPPAVAGGYVVDVLDC